MSEKRISIFDKSFELDGKYFVKLKCGAEILYSKRSEVWFDKARAQFVTLKLLSVENRDAFLGRSIICAICGSSDEDYADIRYNDVSLVLELK